MSKDTAFFNGETTPRHTLLCSDLQYSPPGDPIILCACITKTSITGKSFCFGYKYPMLTAAIASWHRLCGKRYLNVNQNSQPHYSTIIWGYFGPKVSNESQRGLPFFFSAGPLNWYFGVNPFLFNLWSTPRKWPLFSMVFLLQQWRVKGPLLLTYILLTKVFSLDFLRERLVNLLRFSVADVLSLMSLSSVTNLPLPLSYSCSFALADPHKTTKNYKLKICSYNLTL